MAMEGWQGDPYQQQAYPQDDQDANFENQQYEQQNAHFANQNYNQQYREDENRDRRKKKKKRKHDRDPEREDRGRRRRRRNREEDREHHQRDPRPESPRYRPPRAEPPRAQPTLTAFKTGDLVDAFFGTGWFPAKIMKMTPFATEVEFIGYESQGWIKVKKEHLSKKGTQCPEQWDEPAPEQSQPATEQKRSSRPEKRSARPEAPQPKYPVGSRVSAWYEDEDPSQNGNFPAKIVSFEDGTYSVVFDGYEDYEPTELREDQINELDENEVEAEEKHAEPEEEIEMIFEERDKVKYCGDEHYPESPLAFIRYVDRERGCYKIQIRNGPLLDNVHPSQLEKVLTLQDKALCCFAVFGEKKMSKYDMHNTARSLFGRGLQLEKILEDRNGNPVWRDHADFGEDEPGERGYESIVWVKDELPKIPSFCPPLPPIMVGTQVKFIEGNSFKVDPTLKFRAKDYDRANNTYIVKSRDNGDHEGVPPDQLIRIPPKRELVQRVFAVAQKRKLMERDLEGMYYALHGEKSGNPEYWLRDNGEEWSKCEKVAKFYVWKGPLPPKPDASEIPDFPEFYVGDRVQFNMGVAHSSESQWFTGGRVEGHNEDGTLALSYKDRDTSEVQTFNHPADQVKLDIWGEDKICIIFGAFQKMAITFDEMKAAYLSFFGDEVRDLSRHTEKFGGSIDVDEEKKTVEWVEEELPPENPNFKIPRTYKRNMKVEHLENGKWDKKPWKVDSVNGDGTYTLTFQSRRPDENEMQTLDDVPASDMKPFYRFENKVRAIFGRAQKYTLTFDEANGLMKEMFNDSGYDFGNERRAEKLNEKLEIDVNTNERTMDWPMSDQLPGDNLQKKWDLAAGRSLKEKIRGVFVSLDKNDIQIDKFNEEYKDLYDDRAPDLDAPHCERISELSTQIADEIIYCKWAGPLGSRDGDEDFAAILKERKIEWDTVERVGMVDGMNVTDNVADKRNLKEVEKFLEEHEIAIVGEEPLPKPALTFGEAWKRFDKTPSVKDGAQALLQKLESTFKEPTHIQACSWPCVFTGRDLIGISKTGSGKTLAFGLPIILRAMLQKTKPDEIGQNCCHALVVVPTQELCQQVADVLDEWGRCVEPNVNVLCAKGGSSTRENIATIERGVDVVVGTVGRLLALLAGDHLDLRNTVQIVLDEADTMLQGFQEEVTDILCNQIRPGKNRQCLLFSATYSEDVESLENNFWVNDPLKIVVTKQITADKNVIQNIAIVGKYEMMDATVCCLQYIKRQVGITIEQMKVFLFCNSKRDCNRMMERLPERLKMSIDYLSSAKRGQERMQTLQDFKDGRIEVLVVTNVAARGIDITGITVVNYEFPMDNEGMGAETYVHRIGRAFRIEDHDDKNSTDKGQAFTIDHREPEWGYEKLLKIIHQADQVAPKAIYEESGQEPPENADKFPENWPRWAGGKNGFESAVYENDDLLCKDFDEKGKEVCVFESLAYWNAGLKKPGNYLEQLDERVQKLGGNLSWKSSSFDYFTEETFGQIAKDIGASICVKELDENKEIQELYTVEYHAPEPENSDDEDEEPTTYNLLRCLASEEWIDPETKKPEISRNHFRPLFTSEDREELFDLMKERRKAERDRMMDRERAKRPAFGSYIADQVVEEDFVNWSGKDVNVFYPEDNNTYPATCTHDDGETITVAYHDTSFGEEYITDRSRVKALGNKRLNKIEENTGKVGLHVEVEYQSKWYGATVTDDFQNGDYMIKYDDESFGEDCVPASRIRGLDQVQAEPAAESWVGKRVQVEFDGQWYPATVTADDGVSNCTVKFDDTSFPDETVEYSRVKEEEAAPVGVPEAAASWVGKKVNVEYENQWYPAVITADDGAKCSVKYDDGSFGEEHDVPYERIQEQPAEVPEAAASWVGKKVNVEFEKEWYPAVITADDGAKCSVKYDDENFGEEHDVPYERIQEQD